MWPKLRFKGFILFLLSGLVLVTRGADVFSLASINRWGLQVIHHCFSSEQSHVKPLLQPPLNSSNAATAWLTAQKAACQQDQVEAELAWRRTLASGAERLVLVRSAARYDVALAQYATDLYPEQAKTFFWLGDAYQEADSSTQALKAYETGLAREPEINANAWVAVGLLYEAEGNWELAVHAYDRACRYVDDVKHGCLHAGRLYLAHEQYELAAQSYRDSIIQLPRWQPAQLGLAQALLGLGQIDEAQIYLTRLANEGNTSAQALLNQLSENQKQP